MSCGQADIQAAQFTATKCRLRDIGAMGSGPFRVRFALSLSNDLPAPENEPSGRVSRTARLAATQTIDRSAEPSRMCRYHSFQLMILTFSCPHRPRPNGRPTRIHRTHAVALVKLRQSESSLERLRIRNTDTFRRRR